MALRGRNQELPLARGRILENSSRNIKKTSFHLSIASFEVFLAALSSKAPPKFQPFPWFFENPPARAQKPLPGNVSPSLCSYAPRRRFLIFPRLQNSCIQQCAFREACAKPQGSSHSRFRRSLLLLFRFVL